MSQFVLTKRSWMELRRMISEARAKLENATEEKGIAGAGSDAWHDEGHKIALVDEMNWSQRLGELQRLATMVRVVVPKEQSDVIQIGNGVVLEYEDGTHRRYYVEGYAFGKFSGVVSAYSPLGRELIGCSVGDIVTPMIAGKEKDIEILEILLPSQAEIEFFGEENTEVENGA